ncbi:MAG: hypothetical protein ABFD16_20350 [Thermoguttaceae bacterium]|jgi:hypothetical protein
MVRVLRLRLPELSVIGLFLASLVLIAWTEAFSLRRSSVHSPPVVSPAPARETGRADFCWAARDAKAYAALCRQAEQAPGDLWEILAVEPRICYVAGAKVEVRRRGARWIEVEILDSPFDGQQGLVAVEDLRLSPTVH